MTSFLRHQDERMVSWPVWIVGFLLIAGLFIGTIACVVALLANLIVGNINHDMEYIGYPVGMIACIFLFCKTLWIAAGWSDNSVAVFNSFREVIVKQYLIMTRQG